MPSEWEIARLYEEKLYPYELRATQHSVLAMRSLKGLTLIAEPADVLGLKRMTPTRSVNQIEDDRRIAVVEFEDDGVCRLKLTSAGRERVESTDSAWKKVQDETNRQRGIGDGIRLRQRGEQ